MVLAFNDGVDATMPGIYFWPRIFSLENFSTALASEGLVQAAIVGVARTVLGTFLTVLVTSAFAYSMSKAFLRFRNFYLIFLMIPMYFGGGMVPTYILLKDLNLLKIADQVVHFGPKYVGKCFLRETGNRYSEYLYKVRMEKAKELLVREKDWRIEMIAEAVGLGHEVQYFYQLFKKYTGTTPKEYRTRN